MSELKMSAPSTQQKGGEMATGAIANDAAQAATTEQGEPSPSTTELDQLGLQHRWTLYYNGPKSHGGFKGGAGWNAGIKKVADFENVEGFWTLFNNLMPPSQLPVGSNFHLFKGDVRPEWEDQYNEKGGAWVVKMNRSDGPTPKQLDDAWLRTIMFMVGDNFVASDDICGVVCVMRKTNRFEMWTRSADNEVVQMQLGEQLKQCLKEAGIEGIRLSYKRHADSLTNAKGNRSSVLYEL